MKNEKYSKQNYLEVLFNKMNKNNLLNVLKYPLWKKSFLKNIFFVVFAVPVDSEPNSIVVVEFVRRERKDVTCALSFGNIGFGRSSILKYNSNNPTLENLKFIRTHQTAGELCPFHFQCISFLVRSPSFYWHCGV